MSLLCDREDGNGEQSGTPGMLILTPWLLFFSGVPSPFPDRPSLGSEMKTTP